jgi:hypothetical protein
MSTLGVASRLPACLPLFLEIIRITLPTTTQGATKLPETTSLTFSAALPKFAATTKFPTGAGMNQLNIFMWIG